MKPSDPIVETLAGAHTAINERHADARGSLLADLTEHGAAPHRARWLLGGVGVAAACVIAAAGWLLAAPKPLSAMERMARAMEEVSSFSWRMEIVSVSRRGEGRTVRDINLGQWRREPACLFGSWEVWETLKTNTDSFLRPKLLVDIEETHQAGRRGMLVNHLKREFHWIDGPIGAHTVPGNSPQVLIYKVRNRQGRVVRDLGTRTISGAEARGVELLLDDAWPESDRGPVTPEEGEMPESPDWGWRNARVELWIDPATNLPIEFNSVRRGDDFETRTRLTDLRWNVEFDDEHFIAKAPEGYTEKIITKPE